jgi:hypothetical protein
MALLASEGVSVGFAHFLAAVPAVPTQPCGIVIAMIAASAANKRPIFSIRNHLHREAEVKQNKTSPLFEIALVLVRFNHVARVIVNANHSIM